MDRESVERLRFDRRLLRRREWVAEGEYEAYTEALPDVSDKMTRIGDEGESQDAGDAVAQNVSAPSEATAEPGPGGYSTGGSFPDPGGSSTPS
jgi:hypothetical protein